MLLLLGTTRLALLARAGRDVIGGLVGGALALLLAAAAADAVGAAVAGDARGGVLGEDAEAGGGACRAAATA